MLPIINIFGFEIATYGLCIFIGLIVGLIFAIKYFAKFNNIKKDDVIYSTCYAVIGVGFGAKLLYLLTNISFLIENYKSLNWTVIEQLFRGGFVFYGGLIGGVLGIFIYSKQFKISFKNLLLTLLPIVPLIHSIGRIGCFLAGCCYGIEYSGFGHVIFQNTLLAPTNIPLFPTQIIESICNLIIFIVLIVTYKKYAGTYKTITLYCILYSMVRFTLEFFRGDLIRGSWLNLSTSQWISIVVFLLGIYLYNRKNKI